MKFSDFGLTVRTPAEKRLEGLMPFFEHIAKASPGRGDRFRQPAFPLEQVVHQWVRANIAQRRQLINDLYAIAYSCAEIRTAIYVLKMQVFK